MKERDGKIKQNGQRRVRTENERPHRRDIRTQKNVGTKAFGSRKPSQISGRKADRLSSCPQGLLGAFG